ncbi:Putative phospholipid/glycerol acyltransferase [Septoria linicola]|uniref:Tafazzin family protein n=1 Tax=Septoria linicola TaxID=215465 RepID=A0A9Q9AP24_9PEZI|nr:putative phospholipid/glycerol acyltransferase [Septoria linicola]USW52490.1 Putative phospholipid/glycerol acyltransferase [Septoria linicola]
MAEEERPYQPSLPWRITSSATLGTVGFLCRSFLFALNRTEVHGLDRFLTILDEREDEQERTRGLVTVSNHVSVLDDPLIWGVLPHRYFWKPNNMRWSMGSYDICFTNGFLSAFFSYGNTLPTHRSAHSKFGGLFQPTMTESIRLLSDPHHGRQISTSIDSVPSSIPSSDPFSSAQLSYTTTGYDTFPAPSAWPYRRHSWVHIFPEGMIHQHPARVMRYFKWGIARLILESDPCPDVVPIWIDGPQHVMDNERTFPRFLPRVGKDVTVAFGEKVNRELLLEPFRERWRKLKERARRKSEGPEAEAGDTESLGVVIDEELKFGREAQQLRIEVTLAMRDAVLQVRKQFGLPDEDPKRSLADSYREEGVFGRDGFGDLHGVKRLPDGSTTKDM